MYTTPNRTKITITKTDPEDIQDEILEIIEKTMEAVEPEVSWDNDGIGPYEYWGARGFDKGTNYLVCEGNVYGDEIFDVNISKVVFDTSPEKDFSFYENITAFLQWVRTFAGHLDIFQYVADEECEETKVYAHCEPSIKFVTKNRVIMSLRVYWCNDDCERAY